ncbi:hypothetical protein AB5J62_23255 [Amycolatopsis sp. cg5]|uniref:hypothetical protein n=1 Tax=Amycolatopsis sp. cg5 TaxID=3238802 RepID=UPI003524CC2F
MTPDWPSRLFLILPSVGIVLSSYFFDWRLSAPTGLLAGTSLLAGALLSAFTHLSTLRMKVTEWTKHEEDRFSPERAMLDESAAHLLLGALICALNSAILVLGMNVSSSSGEVTGVLCAISCGLGCYVLLMFFLCLPRMYSAYVELNDVSDSLSGFNKDKKDK